MNDDEQIFTITKTNSREKKTNKIKRRCSICLIYSWIIFIVWLPSSGIIIGFLYRNQCSLERHIFLWEIINGSVTLFFLFLIYLTRQISTDKNIRHEIVAHFQDRHWSLFIFDQLKILCILFLVAWFICGNIWIYRCYSKVQYDYPTQIFYCHPILYRHAFWYITTIYICLGLCLIFSLILPCLRQFSTR